MLIDDIKKANLMAMKEKNQAKRSAYSSIISRYQLLKTKDPSKEIKDEDVLSLIQKVVKELDEEIDSYQKAGREESVLEIQKQKDALKEFIPAQLSEEEIKEIILSLPDKSIPTVMKHFNINYRGKVDMSLVNKVLKGL